VSARFGGPALEVAEDVARRYAEDLAVGAALWALDETKKRPAVVPPVVPGALPSVGEEPASSMADFGEGRSMADFAEGRTMSDFAEPTTMADHGEGRAMRDFAEGRRMDEFPSGSPPSPPPAQPMSAPPKTSTKLKVQLAVAAAAVVVVMGATAAAVTLSGSGGDDIATIPSTPPTFVTSTTDASNTFGSPADGPLVQGTRIYEVTFTVTESEGDDGLPVGHTESAELKVSCFEQESECWTELVLEEDLGQLFHHVIVEVNEDGEIVGASTFSEGENDPCGGTFEHAIEAVMDGDTVEGTGTETEHETACAETLGFLAFEFSGTLRDEQPFVVGRPAPTVPPSTADSGTEPETEPGGL
jgi:hypothetical protein